MFIIGNLLIALGRVLGIALEIYLWVIVVRALISWVNPDPFNPIVVLLRRITEPALRPVRRLIPMGAVGIDLSPMVVALAIIFARYFFVASLIDWGYRIKQM
jgi:YggT family protein